MQNKSLILLLTFALSACAKEQIFTSEENVGLIPIQINSSIAQEHTKVTADGFVDKDALGLFAVNYSENNTVAGTLKAAGNQADNVKYVFNEADYKWTPVKSVYYKDINTNVDLYLYYPYQDSISDVNSTGFEVKKDQSAAATATSLSGYEASDFLWGKAENVTPSESKVSVSLSHMMSAVNVTLLAKAGFEEGEFERLSKSIILTGTTRKAKIDYSTGHVTPVGEPQFDGIVMCQQENGSFRAITVPQMVEAGTKLFSITIDGVSYSFKHSGEVTEYQSGKQMDVTINITKKVPSGEYELTLGDIQITQWKEDKNSHGGEARQYYVVNLVEPGTLQSTLEAAGKNPAKIRNLKIVGKVNDEDIYFMRDGMTILEAINMKESIIVPSGKIMDQSWIGDSEYENKLLKYGVQEGNGYSWIFNEDNQFPEGAFYGKTRLCYFVFPETVTYIGKDAFRNTSLSGTLILPDGVSVIDNYAFAETNINSVVFPNNLRSIGRGAFASCSSLQGNLNLPASLLYIGSWAFRYIGGFSGHLILPDIEYLGGLSFNNAGHFAGDLVIPSSITKIYSNTFASTSFSGSLIFEGEVELLQDDPFSGVSGYSGGNFDGCGFNGDLIIPEGCDIIPESCFSGNKFANIVLPNSVRRLGSGCFSNNKSLLNISFNEGLVAIGSSTFAYCDELQKIDLPSTIQTIGDSAFYLCYGLSGITCQAVEPPTVFSNAFNGVAKDNFTVEVPEQSIIRYQTETGWSDFKRICAHYDFSIGRAKIRLMNKGVENVYTLRCPSGLDWSVGALPEWVSVTPDHGTGKTEIIVSISDMDRTSDTFEVNEGSFQYPKFKNYAGRAGEIIFSIPGKDYTCKIDVEQYDCNDTDGDLHIVQESSKGSGIDIVFIGEGFDAKDIASGKFANNVSDGYKHFFNIEPYNTYKDYFNVYSIVSMSEESGIGTVNTIVDNKFRDSRGNGEVDCDKCLNWVKKAKSNIDFSKSVIILLENTPSYYGWTHMYADGSAVSVVPVSQEAYPFDFRGIIQHEAGGHAFGKLGDEYIYHNGFVSSCQCLCCDHPNYEYDPYSTYGICKSLGWYRNLSMRSDHTQVPWAHLVFHPAYSDKVDMYEGGYMHTRGMYRSEITSCMNNNIPYFSAISRQAIVERIMELSGEEFSIEDFYAHDSFAVGTKSAPKDFDWTFGVDPSWNRGPEHGSVIYMGEHPNVK